MWRLREAVRRLREAVRRLREAVRRLREAESLAVVYSIGISIGIQR